MEVGYAEAEAEEAATRRFASGAVRSNDVDHLRFDLIPPNALKRLAARYAMGAEKYGDHNYLKGIPYSNIINHLEAHLNKFKTQRCVSDDNLAAIAWAACSLMVFEDQGRDDLDDLYDFPGSIKKEGDN